MKTASTNIPADWQAESDMRTLLDAEAIRKDKKRFAAAKKMAKQKAEEMEATFEIEPNDKD